MSFIECEEFFEKYDECWIGEITCDFQNKICTYNDYKCIITYDNYEYIENKCNEIKKCDNERFLFLIFRVKTEQSYGTTIHKVWTHNRKYVWN
jgi:hypothetical protein